MLRRLTSLCWAVSLLLCLAAGGVWVRSCFASDEVEWEEPGEAPFVMHAVYTACGRLCFVEDIRGMREEEMAGETISVPTERRWAFRVGESKLETQHGAEVLGPVLRL